MKESALLLLMLVAQHAFAASDSARAQIAAERRAVEVRFHQTEQACRERFGVTACVEQAKAERRSALAGLRERQMRLDDADRRRRAAERLEAIEAKRSEAASRPAAAPASAAASRAATGAGHGSGPAARTPANGQAAAQRAAAQRAAAADVRRQQAASERDKIAQRVKQRAEQHKNAAPLPPPASAASTAGR